MSAADSNVYRGVESQRAIRAWCDEQLDRWPVPHERRVVPTSAGETHVLSTGSGPPAVVYVPGTNTNAASSLALLDALAAHWPTLAVDLPGQPGLSAAERPRRGRMAWYGSWLAELLEAVAPAGATVVGHSLGGAIALACNSPCIGGRVLVSTGGLARLRVGPAMLGATLPWMLRPSAAHSAALLRHMLAPDHAPSDELVAWYTLVARHCRSSLAPSPLPAALLASRRDVPCVVATGEHDAFLSPQRLHRPARERLGADVQTIPGTGHLVPDERPEAIVALVEQVLLRSAASGVRAA